jgi:hypothetical protein
MRPHVLHALALIEDNQTTNLCGIAVSLWKSGIHRNRSRRSGFGAGIVTEGDPQCCDCIITENEASDSICVVPWHQPGGFEIWGSGHLAAANTANNNQATGMPICGTGGNIVCQANVTRGNLWAGYSLHPIAGPGIVIRDNTSIDDGPIDSQTGVRTITPFLNIGSVTAVVRGNSWQ